MTAIQTTMKQTTITYEINDSVIPKHIIDHVQKVIAQYKGKEIDITIGVHKKKRTNPQNAYLHGVVIPMVTDGINEHGNEVTQSQVKDLLKQKFLSFDVFIDVDYTYETLTKDTSELSTVEFNEFIERIQRWGAEMLGIIIPDPETNISHE
jgi:chromosomal replication initiation ATPase DnaA